MTRQHTELVASAHHESGHAVAAVLAFRTAKLPLPAPLLPVRYVEIAADGSGTCAAMDVYSMKLPIDAILPAFRLLMEARVTIHLSGGIAEAIHRGERRRHEVLRFATRHCNADADLRLAAAVQADLRRLRRYDEQHLVDRTLAVLLAHWPAVEAVASALIENGRIEGKQVEHIIDHSMIGSAA